jgi:serine/threonine protein kinase
MSSLQAIVDQTNYRITRTIAAGGMGTVYEAMQDGTSGFAKRVAIKTILPQFSQKQKVVDMFVAEAKLVADLVHENIVQIYQLGKTDNGYYIVMEYVNGQSLHEFIRFHNAIGERIPEKLAVFITSRIARGLAYAHKRIDPYGKKLNIVHSDVCPNNIMMTTEGLPKLTDFGIAIAATAASDANSKSLMGKTTYMSPEQARKEPLDFRCDMYSLGIVLFEMLAQVPCRYAESEEEMIEEAKKGKVEWDFLPEDTPEDVVEILHKMLAPKPEDRYETTSDMARALEYYIYKDGYGPTVQTLEEYLRKQFPYLYQFKPQTKTSSGIGTEPGTQLHDRTMVMPEATMIMDDDDED